MERTGSSQRPRRRSKGRLLPAQTIPLSFSVCSVETGRERDPFDPLDPLPASDVKEFQLCDSTRCVGGIDGGLPPMSASASRCFCSLDHPGCQLNNPLFRHVFLHWRPSWPTHSSTMERFEGFTCTNRTSGAYEVHAAVHRHLLRSTLDDDSLKFPSPAHHSTFDHS